jgi:hypothetical protein
MFSRAQYSEHLPNGSLIQAVRLSISTEVSVKLAHTLTQLPVHMNQKALFDFSRGGKNDQYDPLIIDKEPIHRIVALFIIKRTQSLNNEPELKVCSGCS